jgi:hypothetical protein
MKKKPQKKKSKKKITKREYSNYLSRLMDNRPITNSEFKYVSQEWEPYADYEEEN